MTKPILILIIFILTVCSCAPRQANFKEELDKNNNRKRFSLTHKRIVDSLSTIGQYKELEELVLNFNAIQVLPEEIGNLRNLKSLHLYGNRLTDLPSRMSELSSLEYLVLGRNPLKKVPPSIKGLPTLRILSLDDTSIELTEIDVDIIASLSNLEILDLSEIETISSIPTNISKLKHVKSILLKKTNLNQENREKIYNALPNTRLEK